MAEAKRYYWLRLHDDFFDSKRIKKLRKMAGGDTYTIIYLKMQLLAMKTDGVLTWTGLEDDFADELALDLDEEPDNVRVTLSYLLHCGLAETSDNVNFFFPYAIRNTGSESSSAQRVRAYRERQKALPCNTSVTPMKQTCNVEIEKEIEIDTIDRDIDTKPQKRFVKPTLEEVQAYCRERNNNVDAEKWYDHYTANGWKVGKNPMKDWKASIRTWEKSEYEENGNKPKKVKKEKSLYDNDRFLQPSPEIMDIMPSAEEALD